MKEAEEPLQRTPPPLSLKPLESHGVSPFVGRWDAETQCYRQSGAETLVSVPRLPVRNLTSAAQPCRGARSLARRGLRGGERVKRLRPAGARRPAATRVDRA